MRNIQMTFSASMLALFALAACGGGGRAESTPEIPDGIPVVVGGFIGWSDVQTTPDGTLGIVNAQGQHVVSVDVTDAAGTTHFDTFIAPGAVWSSGADFLPGFYLVSVIGTDGRIFRRYFNYAPDIGWEAAVISNANWDLGF